MEFLVAAGHHDLHDRGESEAHQGARPRARLSRTSGKYGRLAVQAAMSRIQWKFADSSPILVALTSNVSKTAEPFFALHGFHVVERRFPVRRGMMLENALMRKALPVAG